MPRTSAEKPGHRAVSALERAEQRQLQEALALSQSEAAPGTLRKSLGLVTIKRCCNNPWLFLHALRGGGYRYAAQFAGS